MCVEAFGFEIALAVQAESAFATVFGGMVAATALTLVFVPVFYALIEQLREGRSGSPERQAHGAFEPQVEAAE